MCFVFIHSLRKGVFHSGSLSIVDGQAYVRTCSFFVQGRNVLRRLFVAFASLFLVLSSLLIVMPAYARTGGFSCSATSRPVIDVTEKVIHDVDSGIAGNNWAYDTVTRRIRVWNMGGTNYCGVVTYDANFHAIAGQTSPGATGVLSGEEHGEFNGGYVTVVFSDTLNVRDPSNWPLKGKVNHGSPVDYMCDVSGSCPGVVDWFTMYFTNANSNTVGLADWGWRYVAADRRDGVWINANSGNSGDILDKD